MNKEAAVQILASRLKNALHSFEKEGVEPHYYVLVIDHVNIASTDPQKVIFRQNIMFDKEIIDALVS